MNLRGLSALVGTALAVTLLAGCGTTPWSAGSASAADPTATVEEPGPSPTPAAGRNDLARGAVVRTSKAGTVRLRIDYSSSLRANRWRAGVAKPLRLDLTAHLAHRSRRAIYLSSATLVTAVKGPDGPLNAPDPVADVASVSPGYLVSRSSSYGKIFTIPPVDDTATSLTVTLTYELLVQSAPGSTAYVKQSASDALTISLAAA